MHVQTLTAFFLAYEDKSNTVQSGLKRSLTKHLEFPAHAMALLAIRDIERNLLDAFKHPFDYALIHRTYNEDFFLFPPN